MKKSKRDLIVEAALIEFSMKPFEEASTNSITQSAGVSKGVLFYHFPSKEDLYLELVSMGMPVLEKLYLDESYLEERDFIERIKKLSKLKKQIIMENPLLFNFMGHVYLRAASCVDKKDIMRMAEMVDNIREKIYFNVDTSLFRDDVGAERVMQLIRWSVEGYDQVILEKYPPGTFVHEDLKETEEDFYLFLEDLRKVFYR